VASKHATSKVAVSGKTDERELMPLASGTWKDPSLPEPAQKKTLGERRVSWSCFRTALTIGIGRCVKTRASHRIERELGRRKKQPGKDADPGTFLKLRALPPGQLISTINRLGLQGGQLAGISRT